MKKIAIIFAAASVTFILALSMIVFIENKEAYWKWRLESNVAEITVVTVTFLIVFLIIKAIRSASNKP